MKKILSLAVILLVFFVSCKNENKQTQAESPSLPEISIQELLSQADQYVDKDIRITGMVQHVCRETGKKMFLLDKSPENRIRIDVNENMGTFPIELEGSTVEVTGTLKELRIDESYLNQWEEELKSGKDMAEDKKIHTGEGAGTHPKETQKGEEADQGTHTEGAEQIAAYRTQIAESGSDHLSFYSITCIDYKQIEE